MRVGGRDFNERKVDVEQAMEGQVPEDLREYFVDVNGARFPPKQVLATVTGWERASFTTMEAQRVLTKLGFSCMRVRRNRDGMEMWARENELAPAVADVVDSEVEATAVSIVGRIAALEASLATAQEAIVGLGARLRILEGQA